MLDFERFGLRECSVALVDIYASNKKASFASAQGNLILLVIVISFWNNFLCNQIFFIQVMIQRKKRR